MLYICVSSTWCTERRPSIHTAAWSLVQWRQCHISDPQPHTGRMHSPSATPPVHRSTRLHFKLLKFSLYDACMTVPAVRSAQPQSGGLVHHDGDKRPWLSNTKPVTQWWASYSPANTHTHTHTVVWLACWLVGWLKRCLPERCWMEPLTALVRLGISHTYTCRHSPTPCWDHMRIHFHWIWLNKPAGFSKQPLDFFSPFGWEKNSFINYTSQSAPALFLLLHLLRSGLTIYTAVYSHQRFTHFVTASWVGK